MKAYGWLLAASLACSLPAHATGCYEHVGPAEARYGIPAGLLTAVVRTESGGNPFALNADGAAYFPSGRDEARSMIAALYGRGARNVDVGCGQISMRHHPQFALNDSLDSARNVDYAASFLAHLYGVYGSWAAAVAHYHSSDPARQAEYLRRVGLGLGLGLAQAGSPAAPAPPARSLRRVGTLYIDAQRVPGMIMR
jgi:soluble lytic murein transglycosylase-like protein